MVEYLPELFMIVIIVFIFHYLKRFIRSFLREIQKGRLKIAGFEPYWARTTGSIVIFVLNACSTWVVNGTTGSQDIPSLKTIPLSGKVQVRKEDLPCLRSMSRYSIMGLDWNWYWVKNHPFIWVTPPTIHMSHPKSHVLQNSQKKPRIQTSGQTSTTPGPVSSSSWKGRTSPWGPPAPGPGNPYPDRSISPMKEKKGFSIRMMQQIYCGLDGDWYSVSPSHSWKMFRKN